MNIFHQKSGMAIPLGKECGAAVIFELSVHFSDESHVRETFLRAIRADLSCTPLFVVMPGCNHPGSIPDRHKDNHYSLRFESFDTRLNCRILHLRKNITEKTSVAICSPLTGYLKSLSL
jgi:hypothetical protein